MDDIVKAALQKWPNVPDCYGWLALDARGDWYMRDERIQAGHRRVDVVHRVGLVAVGHAHVEGELARGVQRVHLREDQPQPLVVDLLKVQAQPLVKGDAARQLLQLKPHLALAPVKLCARALFSAVCD